VSVMFILLPVALLFSAAALGVFLWASASGQFDDLETPGLRILHEDDEPPGPPGDVQGCSGMTRDGVVAVAPQPLPVR
jgi:cbb3-type cytochrome oxidase maturation protein